MELKVQVKKQIELIEKGKPIEAFMKFFEKDVVMRNNNEIFAKNKREGAKRQAEFVDTITEFRAKVFYSSLHNNVSTIAIEYCYRNSECELVMFKGVHKQRWKNCFIIEEDFYSGEYLNNPEFLCIEGL